MTSLHKELIEILNEEKALLSNLYRIVSEERDAIVGFNSKELERILREKEQTLIKLSLWESARIKLFAKNGMENKALSEIIDIRDESPELLQLKDLYNTMQVLLRSIYDIQKINEQFIDRSIIHISTAIKFLENFGVTPKQSLLREA